MGPRATSQLRLIRRFGSDSLYQNRILMTQNTAIMRPAPEKREQQNNKIVTPYDSVLWIRIRSDPELFAGSGLGSGKNHFGSGSGQSGSGMNFKPNLSVKK